MTGKWTTRETTLVQELEQAAKEVELFGTDFDGDGNDDAELLALAARLRARAARVRELEAIVPGFGQPVAFAHGWESALNALTGPISPTEPAATPTEKGGAR